MSRGTHQRAERVERSGEAERGKRSREIRKHGSDFLASGFDEFGHGEAAGHDDAEGDLDVGPAAHPCGVEGDVGVAAAELDDVVDYHDVGDTCAGARIYQCSYRLGGSLGEWTYRTPMANSDTIGIFFLRGICSRQTDLAGRRSMMMSETMLKIHVIRTAMLLSRQ